MRSVLGWDYLTTSILLVLATGIYTVTGGLKAVIYTDLFQSFVLLPGAINSDRDRTAPCRRLHRSARSAASRFPSHDQARQRPRASLDRNHLPEP